MLAVATKCDVSETVIWKLEHDKPVRWETAHLILSIALKIRPGSEAYQDMHALWLKQRQEMAEAQTHEFGTQKLSKHAVEAGRKFRNLVRDLDPVQTRKVLAAAARAAKNLS